jgi:methylenetetrahydrofolate dehydrogenase (NADP+)/methenyltetrahydrofolate cyclohydrolase
MKRKNCAQIGIESVHRELPATASQHQVTEVVQEMNEDSRIDAFLMQYPFPASLDFDDALRQMDPAKDVDGLHPTNLGLLVAGLRAPRPCTPVGIQMLLRAYDVPVAGRLVAIVGRGRTVGRPLANLLSLKEEGANAAVLVLHSGVKNLALHLRSADVVIAAAGAPGLIGRDMVRRGAAVIQTGTVIVNGKYTPDIDESVREVAGWFTPVTGAVGPMTRLVLLQNCVEAAERTLLAAY